MSGDQAVRSISNPFVNRVLVARSGESARYGDSPGSKSTKTFDLTLSGETANRDPQQAAADSREQEDGAFKPSNSGARLYQGSLGFFRQFSEQHPELRGSDLLNAFISELRVVLASGASSGFEGLNEADLTSSGESIDGLISEVRPLFSRLIPAQGTGESRLNIFV